jgi:plastocyanin
MTTFSKTYRTCLLILALFFLFPPGQAATFNVDIRDNLFSPSQLTIDVGDTVIWTQRGFNHNTESYDPPGVWASDILFRNETFSFTFDTAGVYRYLCSPHSATMRATITVRAAVNTPPTVSLSQPANGAVFTVPASVTIEAAASDSNGSVARVEFFDGGTSLGVDTVSPFSITATLAAGSHVLTAKATDNAGASTTSSAVNITVNAPNSPPSVSITSPANGAVFQAPGNIQIQASASDSDGSISKVEFISGRSVIGTVTSSPYTFSLNNLAAGTYTLSAKATDNAGASTTSEIITVTVNAASVQATISAPSRLANGQFQFTINGTPGQTYAIQASSNLADWSAIRTMQAPSASFTFVDTEAASLGHRFYRILQQ